MAANGYGPRQGTAGRVPTERGRPLAGSNAAMRVSQWLGDTLGVPEVTQSELEYMDIHRSRFAKEPAGFPPMQQQANGPAGWHGTPKAGQHYHAGTVSTATAATVATPAMVPAPAPGSVAGMPATDGHGGGRPTFSTGPWGGDGNVDDDMVHALVEFTGTSPKHAEQLVAKAKRQTEREEAAKTLTVLMPTLPVDDPAEARDSVASGSPGAAGFGTGMIRGQKIALPNRGRASSDRAQADSESDIAEDVYNANDPSFSKMGTPAGSVTAPGFASRSASRAGARRRGAGDSGDDGASSGGGYGSRAVSRGPAPSPLRAGLDENLGFSLRSLHDVGAREEAEFDPRHVRTGPPANTVKTLPGMLSDVPYRPMSKATSFFEEANEATTWDTFYAVGPVNELGLIKKPPSIRGMSASVKAQRDGAKRLQPRFAGGSADVDAARKNRFRNGNALYTSFRELTHQHKLAPPNVTPAELERDVIEEDRRKWQSSHGKFNLRTTVVRPSTTTASHTALVGVKVQQSRPSTQSFGDNGAELSWTDNIATRVNRNAIKGAAFGADTSRRGVPPNAFQTSDFVGPGSYELHAGAATAAGVASGMRASPSVARRGPQQHSRAGARSRSGMRRRHGGVGARVGGMSVSSRGGGTRDADLGIVVKHGFGSASPRMPRKAVGASEATPGPGAYDPFVVTPWEKPANAPISSPRAAAGAGASGRLATLSPQGSLLSAPHSTMSATALDFDAQSEVGPRDSVFTANSSVFASKVPRDYMGSERRRRDAQAVDDAQPAARTDLMFGADVRHHEAGRVYHNRFAPTLA